MSLTPPIVAPGTTGPLAAPAVQSAATDCVAAPLPYRADAVMQGAALPAPHTAAVALALIGLALLPALRRRAARPAASR